MFATGMTCSQEQLVMDEEISAMARRIAAGMNVSDETVAANLIKQVGPRGDYLTTEHTLKWIRDEKEYIMPRVSARGPKASWDAEGGKDTYAMAKDKVKEYAQSEGCPVASERAERIREIVEAFEV